MVGEWRKSTWGKEISLEYGKALGDYNTANGKFRVFGSNGPIGWTSEALASGPGVILGRKGAYRGVAFSRTPFFVIDTAYYVVPKTELDMRWLYYAIKHHKLGEIDDGSPIPSTTRAAVYVRDLQVPLLAEQKAIAATLGALDDKIELNRRMNETLAELAQAIFKSWFVNAGASKLPKGWRYAKAAELCEINARTLGKNDRLDRIEYVEISEVARGNIGNIQVYECGEEPSRARRRLQHGDTVLSTVRPDRGSYFLCLRPSPNLIASTGFAVLSPTKAPWSFMHAAITQDEIFGFLGQQADGGAYPAVRPEVIGGIKVPWPDNIEKAEHFHRICAPLYERAEANRQESRILATLRDTLLPKLLSGELRLPLDKQPQLKQVEFNIVPMPIQPPATLTRKTTDEFVEAVVIAQFTRGLSNAMHPLGRKRYNKFAYLAHRKAEDDVTAHYLKKAAGPYSPWAKYQGPEKIACKNGYVKTAKVGELTGFVPGDKIAEIDRYVPKYPICAAVNWAVEKFKFRKNDDLELLATVDYAALDLIGRKKPVSFEGIKQIIATNKEWAAKLKREIFSDANIVRALNELRGLFRRTYAQT